MRLQQKVNTESTSPSIRSIERVLQGGQHLLRIVNDSLELSRYETAQIQLNLEFIDIRSVVNAVSEMIEPLAQAQGLQLQIDCANAPSKVLTDTFRLQQILTNLLSNAVRYTDNGFNELPTDSALATSEVSDVSLDLVAVGFPYAYEFLQ